MTQYNQNKKSPKITCWIFLILIIGFLIWFFRFSDFFQIKQIIVDDSVYKKTILEILNYNIGNKNLFSFPSMKAENEIKTQITNISEIKIYKSPPDALKIVYIERKPMSVLMQSNNNFVVDHYGIAFRKFNKNDDKLLQIVDERQKQISLGDKVLTSGFLTFVNELSEKLNASLSAKITKVLIKENVFEVIVYVDKGFYMIFDTTGSSMKQITDAKKALEIVGNKKIEYLDLRIPGKVYYK